MLRLRRWEAADFLVQDIDEFSRAARAIDNAEKSLIDLFQRAFDRAFVPPEGLKFLSGVPERAQRAFFVQANSCPDRLRALQYISRESRQSRLIAKLRQLFLRARRLKRYTTNGCGKLKRNANRRSKRLDCINAKRSNCGARASFTRAKNVSDLRSLLKENHERGLPAGKRNKNVLPLPAEIDQFVAGKPRRLRILIGGGCNFAVLISGKIEHTLCVRLRPHARRDGGVGLHIGARDLRGGARRGVDALFQPIERPRRLLGLFRKPGHRIIAGLPDLAQRGLNALVALDAEAQCDG
nr:hypothetical protein [Methylocystis hirsuta]